MIQGFMPSHRFRVTRHESYFFTPYAFLGPAGKQFATRTRGRNRANVVLAPPGHDPLISGLPGHPRYKPGRNSPGPSIWIGGSSNPLSPDEPPTGASFQFRVLPRRPGQRFPRRYLGARNPSRYTRRDAFRPRPAGIRAVRAATMSSGAGYSVPPQFRIPEGKDEYLSAYRRCR